MRKYIVIFTIIMSWLLVSSVTIPAFAAPKSTIVRGNVYNEGNNGFGSNDVPVTITCNNSNGKTVSVSTSTSGTYQGHDAGVYQVNFSKTQCGPGSNITVVATANSQSQSQSRIVSQTKEYNGHGYEATADFNVGSVTVPEFNLPTAMITVIGSISMFLFFRKKAVV